MFAALKQRLGIVSVSTTPMYITVQGIDTYKLMKDIYAVWGSTVIQKNMFSVIRSSEVRFRHFFGLDFLYMCQTMYEAPQTRLPRRILAKVIEELKANTWLGSVDRNPTSITDLSIIHQQIPFPLKSYQAEFIKHYGIMVPAYRLKGYLLDAGPGTGKAQPLNARVKVPGGWKRMGDIQVGDLVTARDGTPTEVTGVFPQGKKDIYSVNFGDDRQAECCAEHLWEIYNGDRRDHLAKQVVNTLELIELLDKHPGRIYVPLAQSEQSPDVDLLVDPYLLGVLLGDGGLSKGCVMLSTPDQEILEQVGALLDETLEIVHASDYDYRLQRKAEHRGVKENVLRTDLCRLNVMGCRSYEKFIPKEYLVASHAQRLDLIQGLMDTDGYIDKNSNCSYSTSSEQLALDVQYLVRSLGGIASIRVKKPHYTYLGEKRQGRLSYTVRIRYKKPSELFRLTKKKERANDDHQYAKGLRLRVESVVKSHYAHAQCISVAHEEHLYVTDDFVVTHNTVTNLILGAALNADKVIILTPKNAINRVWEDTVKDLMLEKKSYWISTSGESPSLDHHYYICHYESLEQLLAFVQLNAPRLKNIFVALDESHNFNRVDALRTQMFIELCKMPCVTHVNWASGTPILALGVECIPFLKCVDPLFDQDCEERFRKIYGRDAKRANDILRNRIGHLKFHVPKQDVVDIKVNVNTIKVKIPNGHQFTLAAIGERMRSFIEERRKYYKENGAKYRTDYNRGLEDFKLTLSGPSERAAFAKYQECFKTICSGFDPKLMKEESAYCNAYELRTIIPRLHPMEKPLFKSARSVLKYVDLKIMGEALGGILGRERTRCHVEMVPHIDFELLIDGAKKKTLVFSSFVEVIDKCNVILKDLGYDPALVYGATNKDLANIVAKFYKLPDLNPLAATFQSLSTAVPLTAANNLILTNQPFRSGTREQTIARAARLGQDEEVWVWDILLDTGDMPNISTRSNDIMEWSQQQVASILGVSNVDLDSLALESGMYPRRLSSLVNSFLSDHLELVGKEAYEYLDKCLEASESLAKFLNDKGFSAKVIVGKKLGNTQWINDEDQRLIDVHKKQNIGHAVVLVGDQVIDITAKQFNHQLEVEYTSIGTFMSRWQVVTNADGNSAIDEESMEAILRLEVFDDYNLLFENPTSEEPQVSMESSRSDGVTNGGREVLTASHDAPPPPVPAFLYHGSMYKQNELMPGYKRSYKLVKWDGCEDNTWLYSTPSRKEAILLGISSAMEKQAGLKRFHYEEGIEVIEAEFYDSPLTVEAIYNLPVYLYTIRGSKSDGWMANYNLDNGIVNEYKTQQTITGNIVKTEAIDVKAFLEGWKIRIK